MQKEMKHTPGKWHVENDLSPDGSSLNVVTSDRAYLIATTDGQECGIPSVEEAEANAALIAVAPELLATLKDTLTELEHWHGWRLHTAENYAASDGARICNLRIAAAQTAIARAQGGNEQ